MTFISDFIPTLVVASPGRINLIGEHTDYNMGFVLPTAIDKKITLSFRKNGTMEECHVLSKDTNKKLDIRLSAIAISTTMWENYILGVLHELIQRTDKLMGFDCIIESSLPIGSGLSSSAALACGLAYGLNELFAVGVSKEEITVLARSAEHNFVGTKCGIMDQYASVMSKPGSVLFLDCKSMERKYIPLDIGAYKLVLLNTKVSHSLADGEYNKRLEECMTGVKILQQKYPEITSLRDVDLQMLSNMQQLMDATTYNRSRYVIEENIRVLEAVKALENDDLSLLGELMYQSHQGLQHLYEVSCPELDFLVDHTKNNSAVLGSRMMGGGFGGCTISLIQKDAVETIISKISDAYKKTFGIELEAHIAMPSGGTSHTTNAKYQQL